MEPFGASRVMDPYRDADGQWLSSVPGQIVKLYHIIGNQDTPSYHFEVGLYVILPGESVPVHMHESGEEFAYMKQGGVLLVTENDSVIGEIQERKIVYVPKNAAHGYINHTKNPVELLVWTSKDASLCY